jgi:hypothetical protein
MEAMATKAKKKAATKKPAKKKAAPKKAPARKAPKSGGKYDDSGAPWWKKFI